LESSDDDVAGTLFREFENQSEGIRLIKESASRGCTEAFFQLGKRFLKGNDVPVDQNEGLRLKKECGFRGYPKALYYLGKRFLEGKGVQADAAKCIRYKNRSFVNFNEGFPKSMVLYLKVIWVDC
jgi:TPR repeat protein